MKRCPKCGELKPLELFAKNRNARDGLQCWCRPCNAVGRAAWVKKYPERARAAGGKWAKENPEANRARVRQWKIENPDRARAADAAWRAANVKRLREVSARWRATNAEAIRAKKAAYARDNAAHIRERNRAWKTANRPTVLANVNFRKQRKRRATPPWLTREQRQQMAEFYRSADALNMLLGEWHHVDHIIPINGESVCGLHVPWNLQILTAAENIAKSNKLLDEVKLLN